MSNAADAEAMSGAVQRPNLLLVAIRNDERQASGEHDGTDRFGYGDGNADYEAQVASGEPSATRGFRRSRSTKKRDLAAAMCFVEKALRRRGAAKPNTINGMRLRGTTLNERGITEKQELNAGPTTDAITAICRCNEESG